MNPVMNQPADGPWSPKAMTNTYNGQPVVMMQAAPQSIPGCPPGLEYLVSLDQLIVKQVIEVLEVLTGFEMRNRYRVFNNMEQQCYYVEEETETCHRICCGPQRGFLLHITDNMGREVLRIRREFKCCAGCCWCACSPTCYMEVAIETASGEILGYVRQMQTKWRMCYLLLDANQEVIGKIMGPCCICVCPNHDVDFPIMSADNSVEIGSVKKIWTGCVAECFTKADNFNLTFPGDMDVKMKAVIFGSVFLIDFMIFEQQNNG